MTVGDVLLRCSLCGHEEERPWTAVTWGDRCPRCATGRLLRARPRGADVSSAHVVGQRLVHVMREDGSVCGLRLTDHEWCWCPDLVGDPPTRWARLGLTACRSCRRVELGALLPVAGDGELRTARTRR